MLPNVELIVAVAISEIANGQAWVRLMCTDNREVRELEKLLKTQEILSHFLHRPGRDYPVPEILVECSWFSILPGDHELVKRGTAKALTSMSFLNVSEIDVCGLAMEERHHA